MADNQTLDQEQRSGATGGADEQPITLERLLERLDQCGDVFRRRIGLDKSGQRAATILYCDGLIDSQMYHLGLLPLLEQWSDPPEIDLPEQHSDAERHHPSRQFIRLDSCDLDHLFARLFAGSVIVHFSDREGFYECNIAHLPAREPEESTMELSLKGPRDGLVEQLSVNVALVRKRLRTPNLKVEYSKLGTESKTEIALLYVDHKADSELVAEARRRLNAIRIDSLNGAGQLEELLADRPYSLFPLLDYVGRPDFVMQALMKGRIAVMVDGSPAALIAPGNLMLLIKSPEDTHLPFYFVTLERLLRVLGLALSLFLPGFWIALSAFNTDQLPFPLLATVTISRIGLPLSSMMEMLLMLTLFEVFREAGVRLPRPVGQTVSVVGGLIIGEAAIQAGLTSPTMLVVAAVSAVATFTLVNQSLAGAVNLFRFANLFLASMLGMFGFFVGMFVLFLYVSSLESFGRSYMLPIAPVRFRQLAAAFIKLPWKLENKSARRDPS